MDVGWLHILGHLRGACTKHTAQSPLGERALGPLQQRDDEGACGGSRQLRHTAPNTSAAPGLVRLVGLVRIGLSRVLRSKTTPELAIRLAVALDYAQDQQAGIRPPPPSTAQRLAHCAAHMVRMKSWTGGPCNPPGCAGNGEAAAPGSS